MTANTVQLPRVGKKADLGNTPNDDPLFDTSTAAAYLRLKPKTLCEWRRTGRYASELRYIKIGKLVYYRKSALEEFLASQTK